MWSHLIVVDGVELTLEEAIDKGETAIMLKRAGDGACLMNPGKMMAVAQRAACQTPAEFAARHRGNQTISDTLQSGLG